MAATARIELAGVQIGARAPRPRVQLAGVQIGARAPRPRVQLAGVQIGWVYTPPSKPINPDPIDNAVDVATTADLSWTDGGGATSYDVYWGTAPGSLTLVSDGQAGTSYDPGTLGGETEYFWRVDSVNAYGTTTGDVWSFTTGVPTRRNMWLGFQM